MLDGIKRWLSEKRVAAQQLRLLSSLYIQPFQLFNTQSKVRPETALALSACWHAISRISGDLAVLPLDVYKRRRHSQSSDLAYDHYLVPLLHDSPDSGKHTNYNFRKLCASHTLGYGSSYCEIEFSLGGKVLGWHNIHPNRVQPRLNSGGKHEYSFDNDKVVLPSERVLHFFGLSYDGITGISPIRASSTTLGAGLSADAYSLAFFANSATPSGFIKYSGRYSPEFEKNFRESFEFGHQGVEKAHKIGFLFGGAEFQQAGISPQDAQVIAQKKWSVTDVCRIYGVPPSLLFEWTDSRFSSYEEGALDYICSTISHWACCFEQQMSLRLLSEQERREGYFIEHSLNRLLRGNSEARASFYRTGVQNAWLSPNDIRQLENQPPIEGGDAYFIQSNMMPLHLAEEIALAKAKSGPDRVDGSQNPPDNPLDARSRLGANESALKNLLPGHRTNSRSNGNGVSHE